MRLTRIVCALAFIGLACSHHDIAQDDAELRWRTPKRTYLLYQSVSAVQAQAKAQRKVVDKVDQLIAPPRAHFHMFGYEILWPEKKDQGIGTLIRGAQPVAG